jgi:hypothetical protein
VIVHSGKGCTVINDNYELRNAIHVSVILASFVFRICSALTCWPFSPIPFALKFRLYKVAFFFRGPHSNQWEM